MIQGGVSALHIASYNNMLAATIAMVEEGGGNVNIQDDVQNHCVN